MFRRFMGLLKKLASPGNHTNIIEFEVTYSSSRSHISNKKYYLSDPKDKCHRLRRLRTVNNLTQVELGSALGVSPSTVSRWEASDTNISSNYLESLSKLYKVSKQFILSGVPDVQDAWEVFRFKYYTNEEVESLVDELLGQFEETNDQDIESKLLEIIEGEFSPGWGRYAMCRSYFRLKRFEEGKAIYPKWRSNEKLTQLLLD